MSEQQIEIDLESRYLIALMQRDAKIWRKHARALESGAPVKHQINGIAPTNPRKVRPVTGTLCAREAPDIFNKPKRGAMGAAAEGFIRRQLSAGPVLGVDLIASGRAAGYSFDTLRNARRRLQVELRGNGRAARWSLPSDG